MGANNDFAAPAWAQTENLFRGLARPVTFVRDGGDSELELSPGGEDLTSDPDGFRGHFAVFETWTEIDSWYEGQFIERLVPGAFKVTMKRDRGSIRCQFDHGYNELIGGNLLAVIDAMREDDIGAYAEHSFLDAPYVREVAIPQMLGRTIAGDNRGSLVGASFRFRVVTDQWVKEPKASDYNPKALPERTITQVRLFEEGPVVFPAYPEAGFECCSLSDQYMDRLRSTRSAAPGLRAPAAPTPANATDPASGPSSASPISHARTRARLALAFADL